MKKLKYLAGFIITCIFIFFLSRSKYDLKEISADNYKNILTPNNKSILNGSHISRFLPDEFPVYDAYKFLNSDNFRGNGIKISNQKLSHGNMIEITSKVSGIHYTLSYIGESLNFAWIFKNGLMDESIPETPLIKRMILNLVLSDGFMAKNTGLKSGTNIIIKETDDSFIIGEFNGELDSDLNNPQSISFKAYFKTKYFNSLQIFN